MADKKIVLVTGAGSGIGHAIAVCLARANYCVYASLRSIAGGDAERVQALRKLAKEERIDLHTLELDVLSEASCRAAVDCVLHEQGRIDVLVNNAGMLMVGITEAFSPEQLSRIFDTNTISWLRVNRAVLPTMRRQRQGTLLYIGSTTSRIHEPFLGPYVASKVAAEALAEVMAFEVRPSGIDSVIIVPGAFPEGTDHFAHAQSPATIAVIEQYGDLPGRVATLPDRLKAIDRENGGTPGISVIGDAVRDVLALPHGTRPSRLVIDPQMKGIEDLNALHDEKQGEFFRRMGIDDLIS
jgi:NAD(P)-dependent dehydrogenase (short-subunit alcohol dehydrogenase family)